LDRATSLASSMRFLKVHLPEGRPLRFRSLPKAASVLADFSPKLS